MLVAAENDHARNMESLYQNHIYNLQFEQQCSRTFSNPTTWSICKQRHHRFSIGRMQLLILVKAMRQLEDLFFHHFWNTKILLIVELCVRQLDAVDGLIFLKKRSLSVKRISTVLDHRLPLAKSLEV